jgi:hypothetical protein
MMQDFTDDLLALIGPDCARRDVVPLYATALLYECFARPAAAQTRWSDVNKAIIARWSLSGLTWIKQRAWKDAERMARDRVAMQEARV